MGLSRSCLQAASGTLPLLMVRSTAALWQKSLKVSGDPLWGGFAPCDSSMGLKHMYCVDMPKSLLNSYFNLCHTKFTFETEECCHFIPGDLFQRHRYQCHTDSAVRTLNLLLTLLSFYELCLLQGEWKKLECKISGINSLPTGRSRPFSSLGH